MVSNPKLCLCDFAISAHPNDPSFFNRERNEMKKEPSSFASTKLKSCRYSNEKLISSLLSIWAIGVDFGLLALIFFAWHSLTGAAFQNTFSGYQAI